MQAGQAAVMSETTIYELYHNAELTKSISVIEKELTRCNQIKDSSQN